MSGRNSSTLVSIVVPVYNAALRLDDALEAIAGQTFGDIEVLLVDDGSTDASADICARFQTRDDRFRLFQQENGGVSSARNAGMAHASGPYLMFVDADDIIEPCMVERFMSRAEETGADVVIGGMSFDTYDSRGKLIAQRLRTTGWSGEIVPADWAKHFEDLYIHNYISSSCGKLFCVDILRKHGILFNECLRSYEDYDFVLRVLPHAQKVYCDEGALYHYRRYVAEESGSSRYNPRMAVQMALVSETTRDWYAHMGQADSPETYQRIAGFFVTAAGSIAVSSMDTKARCQALRQLADEPVFCDMLQRATSFANSYARLMVQSAKKGNWTRLIALVGLRNTLRKIKPAL